MYCRVESSWDCLTLKALITTAAEGKFYDIIPNFRQKQGMILYENHLWADDSHEISCLICYFWKTATFEIVLCCKL